MIESFDDWLQSHQVKWRKGHVSTSVQGTHSGEPRPWILPPDSWEEGLWPGIRSGSANSLVYYLQQHGVQKHTGANNLKSSWVLCANLYFPFRSTNEGRSLLAGFLRAHVAAEVESVDAVELEYEETEALHPSEALGEVGGSRGSGQTSPDIAFLVTGRKGLILTENKLAEHSFYSCSARMARKPSDSRPPNPDPLRCEDALAVLASPGTQCHQVTWGRKYWQHLGPTVVHEVWRALSCCPAAHAGYQLFRQQALAEAIASSGKYAFVISCVALDERNHTLAQSLAGTGLRSIADWSRLFKGRARFVTFTHQQWIAWVRQNGGDSWKSWRAWVDCRYGIA